MNAHADDFIEALQGQREISISVIGRKTGRQISLPVWFVLERQILYLLPVKGARTQWLRNLKRNPSITLRCRGQRLTREAQVVQDSQRVEELVSKLRTKYRDDHVARWYSAFDTCVAVPLQE